MADAGTYESETVSATSTAPDPGPSIASVTAGYDVVVLGIGVNLMLADASLMMWHYLYCHDSRGPGDSSR